MLLAESPSFETYSSGRLAEIAARVVNELKLEDGEYGYGSQSSVGSSKFTFSGETEPELVGVAEAEEMNHVEQNDVAEVNGEFVEGGVDEEDDDDCSEFAFHVLCGDESSSPISADEIFSNGRIKPMYPVFNTDLVFGSGIDRRFVEESKLTPPSTSNSPPSGPVRFPLKKLFVEERETASCSSSENDDLDGVPPDTYCVWTPKEMSKKSNSTGSGSSKRWKFRDLLYRSHSHGSTFVFLTPRHQNRRQQRPMMKKREKSKVAAAEEDMRTDAVGKGVTVDGAGDRGSSIHEKKHYLKNKSLREGDRKKSFLPYRRELVGYFADVSDLTRVVHPF